uniref:Uncharacterized protein n=1 Tax=Anguilla anguilla TaxID=7936 RepID=A0A0E9V0N1_ANGAN
MICMSISHHIIMEIIIYHISGKCYFKLKCIVLETGKFIHSPCRLLLFHKISGEICFPWSLQLVTCTMDSTTSLD